MVQCHPAGWKSSSLWRYYPRKYPSYFTRISTYSGSSSFTFRISTHSSPGSPKLTPRNIHNQAEPLAVILMAEHGVVRIPPPKVLRFRLIFLFHIRIDLFTNRWHDIFLISRSMLQFPAFVSSDPRSKDIWNCSVRRQCSQTRFCSVPDNAAAPYHRRFSQGHRIY